MLSKLLEIVVAVPNRAYSCPRDNSGVNWCDSNGLEQVAFISTSVSFSRNCVSQKIFHHEISE
jgi:hypothetical protein